VRATSTRLDDYLSWALVILPVITGLVAYYHLVEPYPMVLAVHVLSVDLLLMCLPFTKLAHTGLVFFSRAMSGAFYGRRGVSI
jgi:nitrate reductase gamma subunit